MSKNKEYLECSEFKNICEVVQAAVEKDKQLYFDFEYHRSCDQRRNAAILSDGKQIVIYQMQRKIYIQKLNKRRASLNRYNHRWKNLVHR
jgi:hypothetical protein